MVHGLETLKRINERASTTHTPGPWRRGPDGRCCVVADTPVPEIRGADYYDDFYGGYLICESVAPRNIPVIAAAPELLEALKRVVDETNRSDLKCVRDAMELIRRIEKGE